jgi:hypothetical protein
VALQFLKNSHFRLFEGVAIQLPQWNALTQPWASDTVRVANIMESNMNPAHSRRTARRQPAHSVPSIAAALFFCAWLLFMPEKGLSLGQPRIVETVNGAGCFRLVQSGSGAKIEVDGSDFPGVLRAARDFQADVERVSGAKPALFEDGRELSGEVVLIGTLGKSKLVDKLIRTHKIDVSEIRGKWESTLTQVVDRPLPGVSRALVIVGSDKRGTIFGIYNLSEQIGVSPWYWWADVPPEHHEDIYVKAGRWIEGEPAVKYRGIFLNDEAPALSGWAKEKFGGLNHQFYEHVFELLLRLRANYLWPAMWANAFNEDDPLNPQLADEYGIVMGTSHHEPMLRAQQEWKRHGSGEWNYATNAEVLKKFWEDGIERNKNYESTITLGMRGDGDAPMAESENIALLEKIVADQRVILANHSSPTLDADPKVWALYKEVQGYYDKGMRVPDDVTLLWSDDNWGNIRRLPTPEERKRKGGAGIYYHFDYVGDPRNYKWLLTVPITKVWEQMNLAREYGADRIWIVNVGDLKPMEFPIEFFLTYARHPEQWGKDDLRRFTEIWAAREFGPQFAAEAADLVSLYTQYNGRRKPEQLEPETFSLTSYHEAERIEREWQSLTERAERLSGQLPAERRDAFFELVLYPVKASAIVNQLYIEAGRNRLYARQGRASANDAAAATRELFAADAAWTDQYNHGLLQGKWNHMMDQTHIGYTYWQEPRINLMPAVSEVQPLHRAYMQVAPEGSAQTNESWAARMELPVFDVFNQQRYSIDVFNSGDLPFQFTAAADNPWIHLSEESGTVTKNVRLWVNVDWAKAPSGDGKGSVLIQQENGPSVRVRVHSFKPAAPKPSSVEGFVEANHYVSIEAEHFSRKTGASGVNWERIPGFGETLSGMSVFPVTAASFGLADPAPTLEYRIWLFESGSFKVEATLAPTLNLVPGRSLRFAVSVDDQPAQIVDALAQNTNEDWARTVSDGVRRVTSMVRIDAPGAHTLKIRAIDPAIVLEKLVVSQGEIGHSYLGPPESFHGSLAQRN